MPTRNLDENRKRIEKKISRLDDWANRELIKSYDSALNDIRAKLSELFERYQIEGELTRAQAAQFLRLSNLEEELTTVVRPYLLKNEELLKELSQVSFDRTFYETAWAIDQAAGVNLGWGQMNPNAVRAAVGLVDDTSALGEVMGEREVNRHKKVLDDAFHNYETDTRRWIGRQVTDGVIKGESVQKLAKRLNENALVHSRNSAMTIARTETLRASGLGNQVAYDQAAEKGVRIRQVWDATLDSRTRPEHARMDGRVRNEETGMFDTPWGSAPGPRRSGIAGQDINCRCAVRPEIEGYTPEVRRIRGEGLQPYQTFEQWARRNGITANRFGQRYDFLD